MNESLNNRQSLTLTGKNVLLQSSLNSQPIQKILGSSFGYTDQKNGPDQPVHNPDRTAEKTEIKREKETESRMPNMMKLITQDYDAQSHFSHGPRSGGR